MISEETRSKMKENRYLRKLVFGYLNSPETREKLRKANLGKKLSEETKEKIRLFRKGKKLSKETREKMRLSRLGPKNHFYGKHHSEKTKEKLRIANLGKIPVNVFKKGNVPVNKGRCIDEMYSSERADEIKKKMSLAKLGKSASPIWLKSMEGKFRKGKNHPMYGKHHTEESRRKISLCSKGKHPIKEFKKGHITWNKGLTKESDERVKRLSEILKTKKYSKEKYPYHGWRSTRKNQIFPKVDTKIEVKIRTFLDLLKVEYFQHKHINIQHNYQCDFFIPSLNLIIETDGMYWHKYPIGREIDHIRTKELIEKGFKVLRLWESEINSMNIDEFKNRMEVIKNGNR